ncbi:TolC family outer membrane protein [Undibacterium sp. Di24W]|uniref:TolC family outer membrane protein n=1 Tax=Undibacterium sp. Di24W TaxID=3413033 RepID=UPI003BF216AF
MNKLFRLTAISSVCMLLVAPASNAFGIGLLEAYQAALKNDPNHKVAKAELIAGKEYETIGRSGLLPSLQYSYSTSKNKGESISPNFIGQLTTSNQDYTSESKGVTLRQTLFNLDAYARFQQGVAQTNLSDAQFDMRNSDLFIRLLSAYSDAKFAEDQIGLYSAQRDTLAEQRRVNDRLFAKGEGTKTDMLETQARLDIAEAMLLEANDALQTARNTLSGIIGMDATQLDGLNSEFKAIPMVGDFQEWKTTAEKSNPELSAARYSLEIAEKEIDKSRAGHAPRIDLNASYNHGLSETFSTRNQDLNMRTIGVQLVIPIYSGGYVNAVSKQAVARRERARAELEATSSKVMIELRKQFNAVNSGAIKIDGLQRAVNSATLLVEATGQSVKGGIRINADLLNAQQQLITAKRDLASARYNYLLSFLKLRVAAGTINIDDLRTVAGYFSVN